MLQFIPGLVEIWRTEFVDGPLKTIGESSKIKKNLSAHEMWSGPAIGGKMPLSLVHQLFFTNTFPQHKALSKFL